MPIRTAIWRVSTQPHQLVESPLVSEQMLEDMIISAPRILSDDWMLIGRQEDTSFGGRIDLLAIAPDGALVLIELKRSRTPREVVAQALDYAAWAEKLESEHILAIYGRFKRGQSLADDFLRYFGQPLDEDTLNDSHQIVIVAASLDNSTERIVEYLNQRDIPINVLCFQVFAHGEEQLLSRAWLLDPVETQVSAVARPDGPKEPWNGEFYVSFGHGPGRSWLDATQYGFVSAGGGVWYSRTLQLLKPGDRIWVKVPDYGFVGVGLVNGPVQPANTFKVATDAGEQLLLQASTRASYQREFVDDEDRCEYFVPVTWLQTVPLENAVQEIGLFGNQNSVCQPKTPKWRFTVERLKERFPNYDKADSEAD